MPEDDKEVLHHLIEEELNSNNKIQKPDFSKQTGRELLTLYLQSKFRQLIIYDSKSSLPIFRNISDDFLKNFSKRLVATPEKRIMIGITGESASGKSTMCRAISNVIKSFNMPVSILATDSYFKDISDLIAQYGSFDALRDNGYDVDSPQSFQLDILKEDLITLSKGNDIYAPQYAPNGTGISIPKSQFVPSNKIIIVEGIATMFESIKDIFDIKVYVETDIDVRKERFLHRAFTERNQDFDNAKKHWNYILEAGRIYVQPAKSFADVVLNGNTDIEYFCELLEYIHAITNNYSA